MNLIDFGLLVKTLRKSSFDENGNPWTRESFSEKINLTRHQLGRLERGDRKYLDTQTLKLLARNLNLTTLEQKEFYSAAIGLVGQDIENHEEIQAQFKRILVSVDKLQTPAFIIDVYADMIAANSKFLKLYNITPELLNYAGQIPAGFNILHYMYSSVSIFRELIGPRWRKYAAIEILLFRRSSLRFRHTGYFKYILKTLLKEKEFDIDWYASHRNTPEYSQTSVHYDYDHPSFGPLSYLAAETVINTLNDNIFLIVYNPMDQLTAAVFDKLSGDGDYVTQKMASWPEKTYIT